MGVIVGGVVTLFALMLFIWATYKHCMENRRLGQPQYRYPGQATVPPTSTTTKKWSQVAQIVGALLTLLGLIATIVFGVMAAKSKS